jgi:hypothetical protein
LLLQSHNLKTYNDHQVLIHHNTNVYSDNTDAFTIHADDLELAKSLLKVDNGIGSWRLSVTEDIQHSRKLNLWQGIISKSTYRIITY